jgi:hypothetical protein
MNEENFQRSTAATVGQNSGTASSHSPLTSPARGVAGGMDPAGRAINWTAISANAPLRTSERSYGCRPEGASPGHPNRTAAARAP